MASTSATGAGGGKPTNDRRADPFNFRPLFDSAAASSPSKAEEASATTTATDFSFAFNVSNFSDRVLRIEIVDDVVERKVEGDSGVSGAECDGKRKRRREDEKMEDDAFVLVQQEEQILNCGEPEKEEVYGDQDEDVVDMTEEPCLEKAVLSISNDCEAYSTSNGKNPAVRFRNIHISSPIIAAKSPFFYKLFSNGMKESEQRHVTLRIKASEDEAFMDLLHFIYSNTLWSTTEHELMDVLMIADKFEVSSCMRYCSQMLGKSQMSLEYALLYLDLYSNVLLADAVRPLTEAAKQFVASHYSDITTFYQQVLDLPLAGFEAVLGSDDLRVASEDAVYDLVLKYVRTHYPSVEERRMILGTRLSRVIRFPFMTCRKLRKVLTCPDFEPEPITNLVMGALFFKAETPHRKRSLAAAAADTSSRHFAERAYKYRPVQITEFELPQPHCVAYLDLKREDCASLFPIGRIYSQAFNFRGQGFFLSAHCNMDQENTFHCFGLFLGMQEKGNKTCSIDYKFCIRMKPKEDFEAIYSGSYTFSGGKAVGYRDLLRLHWTDFLAADSKYFINDILHLKAELRIKPTRAMD